MTFRIILVPGNDSGYSVHLADYCGEERVKTMLLRRYTGAGQQHKYVDELAEFTGFDVEDDKGNPLVFDDEKLKWVKIKVAKKNADAEAEPVA